MEIVKDEGAWVASVPDLPGCNSFGATVADAVTNVEQAKELWMKSQFESGGEIPEPTDDEDFSGKFVLRIPRVLHRSLAYEARNQGVSLNHYASHLLSQRQPLNAFENFAHSLLNSCPSHWRTPWIYGRHEHGKAVMAGRLPGNTEFVMLMRKPLAQYNYKTSIPASVRKQYLTK